MPNLSHKEEKLRFYAFHHPYVCSFVEELIRSGVDGLMGLGDQSLNGDAVAVLFGKGKHKTLFDSIYDPNPEVVSDKLPTYDVDFSDGGAYSQYNWELFFHIPLFIATKLMQEQQFDKALEWFHYIFNPTTNDSEPAAKRYWFFKPFRDLGQPEAIDELMRRLADPAQKSDDIEAAIREWRDHPFEPHRIARRRPGAYEKAVVMKYLDCLIAWGDQLFSRDTIESINEATQLYVLAAKLLGIRPEKVTGQPQPAPKTYDELRPALDQFSNALVAMENVSGPWIPSPGGTGGKSPPPANIGLYFCIPNNEKLLGYWDTVEDRLFKIRNCMNIEGVVRQLPLFEPPIDPALLVRARALGLDLAAVLNDLGAPLPHYRFPFLLQKAREFCEELKQLGGLLLSALEKKDAEELAQVRAGHEKALLQAVHEVRNQQIKEAEDSLSGLEKARELVDARAAHYKAVSARLSEETQFLRKQDEALGWKLLSQTAALDGSMAAAATPEVKVSAAGTCSGTHTTISDPKKVALIANLVSTYVGWLGEIASTEGSAAQYKGQLIRAQQDRDLQIKLAVVESQQIDQQIAAAKIRRQIAENELANHEKQIEQASEIEEHLRTKFTNEDLYTWMKTQVSAVYFQAYKLAYDMAKRAERVYRYDLAIDDSSFIQFGAWDNLRKGLLAGERLSLDLRRLEAAYLEKNRRTYELTRHVSLAQLDPSALIMLRETGECDVQIPEAIFDLDYPGHYLRRMKSVSLTLPCVTGPYTSVSCTLTLHKYKIRSSPKATQFDEQNPENDGLDWQFSPVQSIATSTGRNDAGLFELNFHDERRLPFEGAGVMSSWHLQMPKPGQFAQFDYQTIADVVFHVNYTALEGGEAFRSTQLKSLPARLNKMMLSQNPWALNLGLFRAFSFRHEFPSEWYRLQQGQAAPITIGQDRLPYFASVGTVTLEKAIWATRLPQGVAVTIGENPSLVLSNVDSDAGIAWNASDSPGIQFDSKFDLKIDGQPDELWLVVQYTLKTK